MDETYVCEDEAGGRAISGKRLAYPAHHMHPYESSMYLFRPDPAGPASRYRDDWYGRLGRGVVL